jgi:hypothetical protein
MENPILGGGYTCSECGQYQRTSAICHHFNLISDNMENNMPTAKEFINDIKNVTYSEEEKLITFAKLHAEAALKQASEKAKVIDVGIDYGIIELVVDKSSIINSYPLSNIK